MTLVGLRCLLVDRVNCIHATVIRATSTPVQRSTDYTNTRVLLEYLDSPRPHIEWLTLPALDRFTAVFIEDQLVWARRILPTESNSVAWPAKAYSLLFGGMSTMTVIVEYFCDQERTYLQISDTKQLNIMEAKLTLAQHSQMVQELNEADKKQRERDLLLSGHNSLCHYHVSVFNTQSGLPSWYQGMITEHNPLTKELTVVEDGSGLIKKVNPMMVEVRLSSKNNQQAMVSSTTGGVASGWYNSPTHSPQFHQYYGSNPSLASINPSLLHSEPNLSMNHTQYDRRMNDYATPTGSYTNLHQLPAPPAIQAPPTSHDSGLPEPLRRNERSISLGNIHLLAQNNYRQQTCKRRSSLQVQSAQGPTKRARFADEHLSSIPQEDDFTLPPQGVLSRAVSTPVLCKPQSNRHSQHDDDDELDLIQSIISREASLEGSSPDIHSIMRTQSLTHLPNQLGSLPSLHHASSLHVLQENYMSTPDFTATALGSPPPYGQINQIADATSTTEHYGSSGNLFTDPLSLPMPHPLQAAPHHQSTHTLSSDGELLNGSSSNSLLQQSDQPIHIATSPKKLSPQQDYCDHHILDFNNEDNELSIDREFNKHMLTDNNSSGSMSSLEGKEKPHKGGGKSGKSKSTKESSKGDLKKVAGEKTRVGNREIVVSSASQSFKRGRGRPKLTEDEKQRRKELREMGLMKRSHRRTKEEVLQWKAEKVRTPAKRGRKPGTGKKNMIKGATGKTILVTVDLSKYENGEVFFQKGFCQAYKGVSKCLECNAVGAGDFPASRYCRFLEFRKMRVIDKVEGTVRVEGFAMYSDAKVDDLVPWTPLKTGYSGIDYEAAIYILSRTVKKFMAVVQEEAICVSDTDVLPVWKCAVKGVRELCDTCQTTIFNLHWVCYHCGFAICPTCYQHACPNHDGNEAVSSWHTPWPLCSINQQSHTPYQLRLSQIVPGNVMSDVLCLLFEICHVHSIQLSPPSPAVRKLISLLNRQPVSVNMTSSQQDVIPSGNGSSSHGIDVPVMKTFGESSSATFLELPHSCNGNDEELLLPPPVEAPHMWLCDGDILYLMDASSAANLSAFQWSWRHSLPVVVSGIHKRLQEEIWTPESFSEDYGDELADLVDCRIGSIIHQIPTKTFWDGFENIHARLTDPEHNTTRLLKLKDWPTGEDFCDKLPERFTDIMQALPLPEYTKRDGRFNMVASLPDFFVKPDLGPKMYNAYGTTTLSNAGTTNLHLDVSDAVNVMVYSAIPSLSEETEEDLMNTINRECCPKTVQRIMMQQLTIGALWHIYSPTDNAKIRNFLSKVLEEKGRTTSYPGTDPIHDQLIYMDSSLRQRLWQEEGVKGWAIAQCVGDAVFIPAGAPHQVQNLASCMKVAEDFVSPEHIDQCLKLTEEFRLLSDNHNNHEDKLQIKNILYHSVKDIVGTLKVK